MESPIRSCSVFLMKLSVGKKNLFSSQNSSTDVPRVLLVFTTALVERQCNSKRYSSVQMSRVRV